MTIFVTGPSGFIGSNLLSRLMRERYRVIALFRNLPDNHAFQTGDGLGDVDSPYASVAKASHGTEGQLKVVIGDINQPDTYIDELRKSNIVFHCAAHIGFSKADYDLAYLINVEGTRALLDACHKVGVSKVVHLSACAVLGHSESLIYLTKLAQQLLLPYSLIGWTLLAGSMLTLFRYDIVLFCLMAIIIAFLLAKSVFSFIKTPDERQYSLFTIVKGYVITVFILLATGLSYPFCMQDSSYKRLHGD